MLRARKDPDPKTKVKVLLSFKQPHAETNPYITQLFDSLANTDDIEPICFDWRTAVLGDFDVFHAHWPEALIERRGVISTLARRVLYAIFLLRMKALRIPVVRTVHNIEIPAGISRFDTLLLETTERFTTVHILLNQFTPVPPGSTTVLIEHGHYRDWFARYRHEASISGRIAFFGKIRRYKNVEGLIQAFTSWDRENSSLHVLGSPSSSDLADNLTAMASGDRRIELAFRYIDDAELVREVTESRLIVLPYPEMHNSGSVLAALSLDRPVLVPDNDFNRALETEVGDHWVIRYRGELNDEDLERGLTQSSQDVGGERPDLGRRDWVNAGERHRDAYELALRALGKAGSSHG